MIALFLGIRYLATERMDSFQPRQLEFEQKHLNLMLRCLGITQISWGTSGSSCQNSLAQAERAHPLLLTVTYVIHLTINYYKWYIFMNYDQYRTLYLLLIVPNNCFIICWLKHKSYPSVYVEIKSFCQIMPNIIWKFDWWYSSTRNSACFFPN